MARSTYLFHLLYKVGQLGLGTGPLRTALKSSNASPLARLARGGLLQILVVIWLIIGLTPVTSVADISASKHDFSGNSWSGGKICIVCHTPHNADTTVADAPLWNHTVTSATYTLYSSPSLVNQPQQPRGPSKLCLSCHDGTVAVESFGGNTGNTYVSGEALIGTNLSDDHPISIDWDHQNDLPSCLNCHSAHAGWVSPLPFFDGFVECSSCHDVHNGAPANGKMLRMPKTGSQLCLHCHGK
ncbi:cytochrome c3 family protein [Oligoflexia bacterium]|nr:cytochrome c3 family protein [Oligoflexia bacterium]